MSTATKSAIARRTKRRPEQLRQLSLPLVAQERLPPALTSATVPAGIATRQRPLRLFQLVRQGKEWWLYAQPFTPDQPLWGPYTKPEAIEARRSYLRNGLGLEKR